MGNALVALKAVDLAWENPKAALVRGLFARSEQRLQAQADSEERNTGADTFDQGVAHAHRSSARIIWPKWPTPGRMIFSRVAQACGIAHQFVLRADGAQRVLDGSKIAGAVIEYRNHSRPFVDGS